MFSAIGKRISLLFFFLIFFKSVFGIKKPLPSRQSEEYTDCFSAKGKIPSMIVLDMALIKDSCNALGTRSIRSLSSLPSLLWLGVVTPDTILSMVK